jgi:hypothetical protein
MKKFALIAFIAVIVLVVLTSTFSFKGLNSFEVKKGATDHTFNFNAKQTYNAFKKAVQRLGYSIDSRNEKEMIITGKAPISLISFGINYAIIIDPLNKHTSKVFILTRRVVTINLTADPVFVRNKIVREASEELFKKGK